MSAFLSSISLGKHNLKLFHKREGTFQTPLGGVVTLISVLILATLSFKILIGTVRRENYFIELDATPIKEYTDVLAMKMIDFQ